ncbi:MAG: hypothetical protein ACR2GH_07325 [Pseudonocardia sp.]
MGFVSRGATLVAALASGALAVGCGGSLADRDAPDPPRATPPLSSPFCTAAQANSDAIRPLNSLTAQGGATPAELSSTVEAVRRAGANLITEAPAEIRADVERTVDAATLQLDALVANGGDAAAAARDPELTARLDSPELTQARERVGAYINSNCATGGAGAR